MKTMLAMKTGLAILAVSSVLVLASAYAENAPPAVQTQALPGTASAAAAPATLAQPQPGAGAAVTEDIHDIRGLREIPDPWRWVLYVTGALFGLLALYALWRFLRARKQPALQAHERAFKALERARALMQPEHAREFSFELSDVIRTYIDERFGVRTTQRTTGEFLLYVSRQEAGPLAAHNVVLAEFLKCCDLAKFACWGLTQTEMEAMFQSAWRFVDTTRPGLEENRPQGKSARLRERAAESAALQERSLAVGGVS